MLKISNRRESFTLFVGDALILYVALLITLVVRYGASSFDFERMFRLHLLPFSILFALWLLAFFIAGLYEKHTLFLQKQLPQTLARALLMNALTAIVFFYFIPAFKITPKINLFVYLFVSSILLFIWRRRSFRRAQYGERERAAIIGHGEEMRRMIREIGENPRYRLTLVFSIDTGDSASPDADRILRRIREERIAFVIVDLHTPRAQALLPHLYTLLFSGVRFADMHEVYEDMFDRIPLSLVQHPWFLEHLSSVSSRFAYDFLKRCMDIAAALVFGLLSLALYPFVYAAVKLDDGGPLFVLQERVGRNNRRIRTVKFRTMSRDDAGLDALKQGNTVTRAGAFFRRTRIDELPQLWNVLIGEMSLIGPRPELPSLVAVYEREVPYYRTRHLIKPGLSGWAQLYHTTPPKVDANPDETATKLSYDLYYLKHRSFWLDVKIALKTVRVLLSHSGV